MIDNEQHIEILEKYGSPTPWDVFIKLDVGSRRAGVDSESPALRRIIERAERSISVKIHGFYCHAGHSYAGRSKEAAEAVLNVEIASVLNAASLLAPSRDLVVSIGVTPTAHVIRALRHQIPSNVRLELHAGTISPTIDEYGQRTLAFEDRGP